MRVFIFLFCLSMLSAEAAAPTCDELKKIAGELEKEIQSTHFKKDCDKVDPASLGLPPDSIGFGGDWDYRCKDVSAIDLQLKTIENEIALLKGIDSLKNEIKDGIATLAKVKHPDQAKEASASFVKNLNVATSLELFLATTNTKSENILAKVTEDKAGWTDLNSFAGLLRKHCGGFPQKGTVCEKGFSLHPDTFTEINDFVRIGKFDKRQIKVLSNALAITKAKGGLEVGEIYSFGQLASELKGVQSNGVLAAEDLKVIKDLPELSNENSFDFLKNLKSSIKMLKESEGAIHAQETPARFTALLSDLKKRQEWEMKSKLSLVLNQYEKYLPAEVTEVCNKARELQGSIEECLLPLQKNKELISKEQTALSAMRDLIAEFKYSSNQVAKLDEQIKDCIPDEKLVYPKKCEGILSQNMADLVAKSQVLNALKAKHIQSSPDLITFRNFALEKLHSGECMRAGESNLPECNDDLGNISREAVTLSGNANDIIYVFEKPKEATNVEQLCLQSEEKVPFKDALCELMDEDPSKKSKTKKSDKNYEAPVSPDERNKTGQALFDLGSSILTSIANARTMTPKPPMVNPYGNVFPYSYPLPPARGIKDQIMDPYLARGFGNYNSAAGVRPYSSTNSSVGTASGYNFGGSSHFNSPVGW